MSSEPQEGSVREQRSAAEGTIVQNEEELCRQRRLLDSSWNPQLQLNIVVLPQHWMTEEEDLCNQQRNFRVEQEEPQPPQIQEEQEEPEPPQIQENREEPQPPQIKEEQESFNVTDSQDEEGNQHEETDPQNRDQRKRRDRRHVQSVDSSHMSAGLPQHWMTREEDLCNQQRNLSVDQEEQEPPHFKESEEKQGVPEPSQIKEEPDVLFISQDEERNQHQGSTSTTDEETDPQNRDQRKRRDRSHVQSVDSSHMSESQCDSDVRKNPKKTNLGKKCKQSPKEERLSSIKSGKNSRIITNPSDYMETGSDERCYICKECGKTFCNISLFKIHARIHVKDKRFSCKECDKSFSCRSNLKTHMRTHTGEKPFSCKKCKKRFRQISHLKRHMRTHTGEKPFSCEECKKSFNQISHLKRHMRTCKTFS
ncbi:uncharacterized protein LOC144981319 isoform X5 [Oryzias latipes]